MTMLKSKAVASSRGQKQCVGQNAKVIHIHWEDYQQELARLCSLTSAVNEANQKKQFFREKLQSSIQVEEESLNRRNELDEMREKLESRKLVMGNMSMDSKVLKEKVKKREEQLSNEIRSLSVAGNAISLARNHLQDVSRSLAGGTGYGYLKYLKRLQRLLRLREQYMVSQVQVLYPVKIAIGYSPEQELGSFADAIKSGNSIREKGVDQGPLTIAGLHLTMVPFTKMGLFTDKKAVQRSATALGHVAHAVLLIASYLQVPLRYPLRLGGSRSYIRDYAPSVEPSSSDMASNSSVTSNSNQMEFPLFLEGQDSTRAAYAVFLLNKDLEQLLNYIGVTSLGPRHVLANLKELVRTIMSPKYIDT
ncbi:UV radiation resistance-associated protein-like [Ipomoea triloba]|uniref:UV radiation resistance-associated protein-like n=1 Tax=Ipomoea triloba TaxID=35885 RepID=UPI00125E9732|nr:UV radiation resistance-associated protein-like [Ipomoea triloba]